MTSMTPPSRAISRESGSCSKRVRAWPTRRTLVSGERRFTWRPVGFGVPDLYVSFRTNDGSWTEARILGPKINTEHAERFPGVTRDGKYFFFGSDRNGNRGDIYWMKAEFIKQLKPKDPKS